MLKEAIKISFFIFVLLNSVPSSSVELVNQLSETTRASLRHGVELYNQGNFKDAVETLSRAFRNNSDLSLNDAARDPQLRDAVYKLGVAQSKIGDNSASMTIFSIAVNSRQGEEIKKVIELNTDSAEAHYNLGVAYYVSHGNAGMDDSCMIIAIGLFNKATKLKPNYAEAYQYLGHSYAAIHNYSQSIENYLNAIRIDPSLWESYNGIGHNYMDLHRYKKAIEYYQKALKTYRSSHGEEQGGINVSLANAYIESGDSKNALNQYYLLKSDCEKNKSDCRSILEEFEYTLRSKKILPSRRKR